MGLLFLKLERLLCWLRAGGKRQALFCADVCSSEKRWSCTDGNLSTLRPRLLLRTTHFYSINEERREKKDKTQAEQGKVEENVPFYETLSRLTANMAHAMHTMHAMHAVQLVLCNHTICELQSVWQSSFIYLCNYLHQKRCYCGIQLTQDQMCDLFQGCVTMVFVIIIIKSSSAGLKQKARSLLESKLRIYWTESATQLEAYQSTRSLDWDSFST